MPMLVYEQDGKKIRTSSSFYRGDAVNYHPRDLSFSREDFIDQYLINGLKPVEKTISQQTPIVAFGPCFASNISKYLHERKYNILTRRESKAYVTSMGDGIVHTFAIRQQFEWAWNKKAPSVELWHGFQAEEFGYTEEARKDTEALFNTASVFIITLGLSEIWYDEPSGEVFWRAVPADKIDTSRHKFRVSSHTENLENLRCIHGLIRKNRPNASIIFTISPIPLTATFRPISCIVANAASKAILRSALDEFMRTSNDADIFYFPSYEIVTQSFNHQWTTDRKHVYPHVLEFNMKVFEHYFCISGASREELETTFREARRMDKLIGESGHAAVFGYSVDITESDVAPAINQSDRKKDLKIQRVIKRKKQRIEEKLTIRKAERIAKRKIAIQS